MPEVDGDTALHRLNVAFERRAGAERHHRQSEPLADARNLRHFAGAGGEADDVGRRRRVVRLAAAVMLAHGGRVGHAVAEEPLQFVGRRFHGSRACQRHGSVYNCRGGG